MSELFDDDKITVEEEYIESEDILSEEKTKPTSDARRRLESFLEERRLRDELEDFSDY
jgi:hypothetical protein